MCRPLQLHQTEPTDQPGSGVVVAGRAARRRHNRPAALSPDEIAHEIVRELGATRFSHLEVMLCSSDGQVRAKEPWGLYSSLKRSIAPASVLLVRSNKPNVCTSTGPVMRS